MATPCANLRPILIAAIACAVVLASSLPAAVQAQQSTMSIFYGSGWFLNPNSGVRRLVALLNLSQVSVEQYPGDASLETFSQTFVQFSIPADASASGNETGLQVRLQYYVATTCFRLNPEDCPLGGNDSAIGTDVLNLEIRRVIEYFDGNGNQRYDFGEEVGEVRLSRPLAPSVRAWPFAENWTTLELPYNFNYSGPDGVLTQGVLGEGDPLLRDLWSFWIAVSNGYPVNLTVNSFLFLRPTTFKGIPLTPTELKLDVLLDGIQYASNETAMALELVLSSSQFRLQSNGTTASDTLSASSETAVAFFTWSSNATVDGRSLPVGSSIVPVNDATAVVYLSYPRGGTIVHDPVLGISPKQGAGADGPSGGGGPSLPTIVVISAAIGIAAVAVAIVGLQARRRS